MNIFPTILSGPSFVYVSHLKMKELDKIIMIFGDIHVPPSSRSRKGEWFWDFLKRLFRDSKVCVDFFAEHGYYSKYNSKKQKMDIPKQAKLFYEIEKIFGDCFVSKPSCKDFGNVRMHYADIRWIDAKEVLISVLFPSTCKVLRKISAISDPERRRKYLLRFYSEINLMEAFPVIDYIIGLNKSLPKRAWKYCPAAYNFIEEQHALIAKQLNGLDVKIKNKLLKFFSKASSIFEIEKELTNRLPKNYFFVRDGKVVVNGEDFIPVKIALAAIIMDAYLLSRVLKESIADSKIAVIFAGDIHAERYVKFFESLKENQVLFLSKRNPKRGQNFKIPKTLNSRLNSIINTYPPHKCWTKKRIHRELVKISEHPQYQSYLQNKSSEVEKWKVIEDLIKFTALERGLSFLDILETIRKHISTENL